MEKESVVVVFWCAFAFAMAFAVIVVKYGDYKRLRKERWEKEFSDLFFGKHCLVCGSSHMFLMFCGVSCSDKIHPSIDCFNCKATIFIDDVDGKNMEKKLEEAMFEKGGGLYNCVMSEIERA